jgi:tetrahydromethanopterin S-methyltransferase subunit D
MMAMAMFTVGFIFVAGILSYIVRGGENGDPRKFLELLRKVVLCSILIPMSWWIMAVLIDFSVVMTAAVSSIPLQIIEEQWNTVQVNFKIPKKIVIDE